MTEIEMSASELNAFIKDIESAYRAACLFDDMGYIDTATMMFMKYEERIAEYSMILGVSKKWLTEQVVEFANQ